MKNVLFILSLLFISTFMFGQKEGERIVNKYRNELTCYYLTNEVLFLKLNRPNDEKFREVFDTVYTSVFILYNDNLKIDVSNLILLFEDGSKFTTEKSANVEYSTYERKYKYTISVFNDKSLIESLSKNKLVGFSIGYYEKDLTNSESLSIMNKANNILSCKL